MGSDSRTQRTFWYWESLHSRWGAWSWDIICALRPKNSGENTDRDTILTDQVDRHFLNGRVLCLLPFLAHYAPLFAVNWNCVCLSSLFLCKLKTKTCTYIRGYIDHNRKRACNSVNGKIKLFLFLQFLTLQHTLMHFVWNWWISCVNSQLVLASFPGPSPQAPLLREWGPWDEAKLALTIAILCPTFGQQNLTNSALSRGGCTNLQQASSMVCVLPFSSGRAADNGSECDGL